MTENDRYRTHDVAATTTPDGHSALTYLSLFSGIGGIDLGLDRAGMTCVGQVELDPFCQRVLAKHWPEVPRHDDVRTTVEWWGDRPGPDVVAGGFPCQPVSLAGRRQAQADERWLWPAFAHVVRHLRPRYVFVENVPGLLSAGMGDVLGELAELGYDAEWESVPAVAVGAPHLRWRVWIVAYACGSRRREDTGSASSHEAADAGWSAANDHQPDRHGESDRARTVAHTASDGCGQGRQRGFAGNGANGQAIGAQALADADCQPQVWTTEPWAERDPWAVEPDLARVANGVPAGVDRRRAIGNAVVPQVAEYVGHLIRQFDGINPKTPHDTEATGATA